MCYFSYMLYMLVRYASPSGPMGLRCLVLTLSCPGVVDFALFDCHLDLCCGECYVGCLQFECVPIYVFACFMFDCVGELFVGMFVMCCIQLGMSVSIVMCCIQLGMSVSIVLCCLKERYMFAIVMWFVLFMRTLTNCSYIMCC